MFKNDTALTRCIATDQRWNKWIVSLGSLVALVIRLPISWIVSRAFSFHDHDVSIAIGAKMFVEVMSVYFMHFRSAARFAAAPAIAEVPFRCQSATVSETVTSQTSGLSCDHVMSVASSGCFPSVLDKPAGSLETSIWARLINLQMMSIRSACRCCRALLRLHDSPCRPLAFTSFPHVQVWGSHVRSSNLKPTISSLSLNPMGVIGGP